MRIGFLFCLLALLSACGGGGAQSSSAAPSTAAPSTAAPSTNPAPTTSTNPSTPPATQTPPSTESPPPTPTPAAISVSDAHRFLRQSTMGIDQDDIAALQTTGFEQWIEDQTQLPASNQLDYLNSLPEPPNNFQGQANRLDAWFRHAVQGDDQLRQRVAFALSELMVVSDASVLFNTPEGLADYYDTLANHAFGNFRDLMQAVTLHPAMGVYLSMLGNEKPDTSKNIRPDENYARELMQLFTLGLVEINMDGSTITDNNGEPVPTYTQAIIEGFAHVYTGWTFGGSTRFTRPSRDYTVPMEAFTDCHDMNEKQLLKGVVLPAGQSPEQDLTQALDNVFNHPNVSPFVSRHLIQKLVTANPSPAYINRVALVFSDDGNGQRGNLKAVVEAILLDTEARTAATDNGGKLVEPILRLVQLWRAYNASAANGKFFFPQPEKFFAQAPLRSPSVFNFFSPNYSPSGELSDQGLVSPEMQITNETTIASTHNYLASAVFLQNSETLNLRDDVVAIDIASDIALASDTEALITSVSTRLLGRPPTESLRVQIDSMLAQIPANELTFRTAEVIHAIATSTEFAQQQ
jgi:uncharacterized protein (DUF1800 family)